MISNRCARKSLLINCNSIISKNYLRFLVDNNVMINNINKSGVPASQRAMWVAFSSNHHSITTFPHSLNWLTYFIMDSSVLNHSSFHQIPKRFTCTWYHSSPKMFSTLPYLYFFMIYLIKVNLICLSSRKVNGCPFRMAISSALMISSALPRTKPLPPHLRFFLESRTFLSM